MSAISSNPLESPSTAAERLRIAKLNTLDRILETLPGVSRAKVSHDIKEARFGRGLPTIGHRVFGRRQ